MKLKHFSWDISFWGMYWRYYASERCCSTSRKRLAISGWNLEGSATLCSLQHRWEMSAKSICCQSWEALKTKFYSRQEVISLKVLPLHWCFIFGSLVCRSCSGRSWCCLFFLVGVFGEWDLPYKALCRAFTLHLKAKPKDFGSWLLSAEGMSIMFQFSLLACVILSYSWM